MRLADRYFDSMLRALLICQQTPVSPPPIRPMRQLEDYGYLHEPENRQGYWSESLKYVPLGSAADAPFLTFGGEVRTRYEWIDNTDFGSGPQDTGGYLLTRYLPYVSLDGAKAAWRLGAPAFRASRGRVQRLRRSWTRVPSTKTPLISYRRLPRSRFRWERAS